MSITESRYDIFMNYTHQDTESLAREVGRILDRRGLRIFIDDSEILAGDIIIERITDAIQDCRYFVALVSPAYSKSGWCRHEILQMLVKEANRNEVGILPFRIGESEVPKLLATRKYGSFANDISSAEPIAKEILQVVERDYADSPTVRSIVRAPVWLERMCQLASLARRCTSHLLRGDDPERYSQKMEEIYYEIAKIRTEYTSQIDPDFYDLFEQLQNGVYRGARLPEEERERIERTHREIVQLTQKRFGVDPKV